MNEMVLKNFLHDGYAQICLHTNLGELNLRIIFDFWPFFLKFLIFFDRYPAIIENLGSTLKEFVCLDKNNKKPQLKLEVFV